MLPELTICMGSSCFARGNERNLEIIRQFLESRNLQDDVNIRLGCSLCTGKCSHGPIIMVNDREYQHVDTGMTYEILKDLFDKK